VRAVDRIAEGKEVNLRLKRGRRVNTFTSRENGAPCRIRLGAGDRAR
jgi:hypothetical protein